MSTISTSIAAQQIVNLYNIDDAPLAATYKDGSGNAVDITDYAFEFILSGTRHIKTYSIGAGVASTDHLSKSANVLNMRAMWEDIRDTTNPSKYKLLQVVTDDQGRKYTHIEYTINRKEH